MMDEKCLMYLYWIILIHQKALLIDTMRQKPNGHHFADNIFKCILLTERYCILIRISMEFVPNGLNDNKAALVPVMAYTE